VAISNHRLLAFDGDHVTFQWKDYAHHDQRRTMRLSALEFLRRFVQHILPRGFVCRTWPLRAAIAGDVRRRFVVRTTAARVLPR
jgi:putative transposase